MNEAPTAAQIVGRITKTRAAALVEFVPGEHRAWFASSRRTRQWLSDQGLIERAPSRDVMARFRLTEKGTAVRAILMEQDRHD